jgi:hypothetical protein
MHGPINVKSPNNNSKWQMGSNSAFKRLTCFKGNTSGIEQTGEMMVPEDTLDKP